jgi:hypothetical protein
VVWTLGVKTPYLYNIGSTPLNGDFSKVDVIDRTPDGGDLPGGMLSGRPVRSEHMPTLMRWDSKRKIPDFYNSWCLNVSERAKLLLEEFEPGVHQFLPVEYTAKADKFTEKRHFVIVCNRIDSLDHDRTTMVFVRDKHGAYWRPVYDFACQGQIDQIPPHLKPDTESKLVFSRAKIGGRHMWVDKHLLVGPAWISDELATALTAANLTGLDLNRQDMASEPA